MKAFHGTTRENANKILSGSSKDGYTWNCSDDEYIYLWCPEALVESGECEDMEEARERAITMAFESGQITAATSEAPQNELVVLEFDFDPSIVEDDDSCENMELARRVEDFDGIAECRVSTLTCKHNSRLDALVIGGLLDNPNFPKYLLDEQLIEAAEALREVWLDSLLEFDWEEERT